MFENLPLPPSRQPVKEVALYTSRRIGTLAEIFVLDQRQYRSAQACPLQAARVAIARGRLCGPAHEAQ
ncbi:MAG: alkaline phosphatase D family protein [Proteobacteria bacterium]|nr:alkaline phosphatase D family protein [Pseudomonadota bacterium]